MWWTERGHTSLLDRYVSDVQVRSQYNMTMHIHSPSKRKPLHFFLPNILKQLTSFSRPSSLNNVSWIKTESFQNPIPYTLPLNVWVSSREGWADGVWDGDIEGDLVVSSADSSTPS
jgi:hypothetical protein